MSRLPMVACVFDAYGTLFDVHSVTAMAESLVPGHGADLSRVWRAKQLEYTWLSSLMTAPGYARPDFRAVTAMALDYAVATLVLPIDAAQRADLAHAYESLSAYPDARATLQALAPRPRWILSNGTQAMLDPLVAAAGLHDMLNGVLSVDEVDVYKPSPRVYALAVDRLRCDPASIAFVSANAWDAAGAQAAGFTAIWINRNEAPFERHAPAPAHTVGSLGDVVAIVRAR
ncbi:MAG: haloacid dehalogenase type II [Betaproteobacteria bacterium]